MLDMIKRRFFLSLVTDINLVTKSIDKKYTLTLKIVMKTDIRELFFPSISSY
jgi:hypothetical protein